MTDYVISGLIRRRRELTGDMLELLSKVDALSADVAVIDKALSLFAPSLIPHDIPALKTRPKPDWAMRGEVVRLVFSILRNAPEPMSTRALVAAVNRERGIEGETTFLQIKRLRKCLDRQRARGLMRAVSVSGELCWSITQSGGTMNSNACDLRIQS